ncbi:MAG: hypothetical protein ACRDZO_25095 [Egibacteraceae bacterium]
MATEPAFDIHEPGAAWPGEDFERLCQALSNAGRVPHLVVRLP